MATRIHIILLIECVLFFMETKQQSCPQREPPDKAACACWDPVFYAPLLLRCPESEESYINIQWDAAKTYFGLDEESCTFGVPPVCGAPITSDANHVLGIMSECEGQKYCSVSMLLKTCQPPGEVGTETTDHEVITYRCVENITTTVQPAQTKQVYDITTDPTEEEEVSKSSPWWIWLVVAILLIIIVILLLLIWHTKKRARVAPASEPAPEPESESDNFESREFYARPSQPPSSSVYPAN